MCGWLSRRLLDRPAHTLRDYQMVAAVLPIAWVILVALDARYYHVITSSLKLFLIVGIVFLLPAVLLGLFSIVRSQLSPLWWHRGARFRVGQCRNCGYDLRATPERCPECGTPVRRRGPIPLPPWMNKSK